MNEASATGFFVVWTDLGSRGIQDPDDVCLTLKRQNDGWVATQGTWVAIDLNKDNVWR